MCSGTFVRACTSMLLASLFSLFFFFNDTATTEIYTLSLHDALPISRHFAGPLAKLHRGLLDTLFDQLLELRLRLLDRKSTRLNSSHGYISYAVFCLKKKKKHTPSSTTEATHA